ncbi:MAG TPA: CBS domain-containing protein [Chloroflexi bacterium]|nr:CBS domain-containing protein [Chloroflexota bacterium]
MSSAQLDIILTHERTDFDALASLLGASLLFPEAIPVLPRQMNRNVRDFLALYKNHFRFVAPDDLPRGKVRRAILVDTRAANSPKGTQPDTEYIVIDHHIALAENNLMSEARKVLPQAHDLWCGATGANTTLLVEKLIEHAIDVTPVEATLLALGIYEDTGNLTYASTTSRDAAALAWLLEPARGVNLGEVNEFLHHPVTDEQRRLLQVLMDACEFLDIEGHSIVIAMARAPDFGDELSTLAARLRDFHEPDALFLVVDLGDMVQVVARSTTDAIDVGKVAQALGGGGHNRAAAAHIRDTRLETVRMRIEQLVRTHARVALTVGQIMSVGRPHVLHPDMRIAEADELMRRFGHEGFPVVAIDAHGKEALVGVLTRREVDKAMGHGMADLPVRRFMRAGQHTVRPTDSIAVLRRRMIESNWGQIPVVDDNGAIVGIVTRTDLIKLWDEANLPGRRAGELAARLRRALSPVQLHLLALIGREVDAMHYDVYVVGGFVRDLMLDIVSQRALTLDVDIVIEGDAIAFARRMQTKYGGRIVEHKRFGTAKWLLDRPDAPVRTDILLAGLEDATAAGLPPHLDFVTARTEFYSAPTVLPTVQQSSIKLDLHRRDFTINTLALCLNPDRWGELLDAWGGVADLRAGLVRVLHSLSFVDDPTRILRAVRYEQRFDFTIEPRTLELLGDALELLDRVTPARIRHELERILQEATPEKALLRLDALGVLQQIHPSLHMTPAMVQQFAELRARRAANDADPHLVAAPIERLYLAIIAFPLGAEATRAVQARLGLRAETQHLLHDMSILRSYLDNLADPVARPSQIVQILDQVTPVSLALLPVLCHDAVVLDHVRRYREEWRHVQPALTGDDLRRMGIPRGVIYRNILRALRMGRLDGEIHSRAEEDAMARAMAALT